MPVVHAFTHPCARILAFPTSRSCTSGGERFGVRCVGPTHPIVSVLDNADGTYTVSARYGLSGVYQMAVSLVDGGRSGSGPGSGLGLGLGMDRRLTRVLFHPNPISEPYHRRRPISDSPLTIYVGLQLAEQYLLRWIGDGPRSLPALASQGSKGEQAGGSTHLLAVANLGTWRHDAQVCRGRSRPLHAHAQPLEAAICGPRHPPTCYPPARHPPACHHPTQALLAHCLRTWKLFIGRRILEKMVAGAVPPGSPRAVALRQGRPPNGNGTNNRQQAQGQPQGGAPAVRLVASTHLATSKFAPGRASTAGGAWWRGVA